jgi:hypothetical protein
MDSNNKEFQEKFIEFLTVFKTQLENGALEKVSFINNLDYLAHIYEFGMLLGKQVLLDGKVALTGSQIVIFLQAFQSGLGVFNGYSDSESTGRITNETN